MIVAASISGLIFALHCDILINYELFLVQYFS